MTRKLVDVAQDIICREEDCGTVKGIWVAAIVEGDEVILPLKNRLVGRFSAMDIRDPAFDDGRLIVKANEDFTPENVAVIDQRGIQKVLIRSTLTCESARGVCIKCYGRNLATDKLAEKGDALGIIAAQSIGEPGTQLTMRTFHIGGTASSAYKQPVITARNAGIIKLVNVRTVKNQKGETVVVNKNGYVVIYDEKAAKEAEKKARDKAQAEAAVIGTFFNKDYDYWADAMRESEVDRYDIEAGAVLEKGEGEKVKSNERFIHWDPYHVPIIAEEEGLVELHDLVEGVTLSRTSRGNTEEITVMEHREDLHPQIVIKNLKGEFLANYPLPSGAFLMTTEKARISPGLVLARVPRQSAKNKDITGGLPRIAELFEARIPKEIAEIARIDGVVEVDKMTRGKRQLLIRDPETGITEEHNNIPAHKHLTVSKGDVVRKGQKLTEGSVVPHALLEVCGPHELQRYLVDEIQLVYRAQGVEINDKHIEIIIRQMRQKVKITDQGSSVFLTGEQVDRSEFILENKRVAARGGKPAEAEPVLLGITKASLETESFISAASFQDTTRILTDAATLGKVDKLLGFKENVITGHLIPAGTGTEKMQSIRLKYLGEEIEEELPVEKPESEEEMPDYSSDVLDDVVEEKLVEEEE